MIETEGGHIDFAPLDSLEDKILQHLRRNFRRVSVERIASGRGSWNLYEALCAIENKLMTIHDETDLWAAATPAATASPPRRSTGCASALARLPGTSRWRRARRRS